MDCRFCKAPLVMPFLDLGHAPPSNAYRSEHQLKEPETCYPLRLLVCTHCWLVQTEDYTDGANLFTEEYAYFSSYSKSWIAHARRYVDKVIRRFGLNAGSTVVEIAANDGYLLQYVQQYGIPCYGLEPTKSTASVARAKGIEILCEFFGNQLGKALASQRGPADLIVANNVLAHVQDINDFVSGFNHLLSPEGVATFEFQHLMQMVQHNQFDTAYHEHYSYLSFTTAQCIFNQNGLSVFDVEAIPTHGGSLRVFVQKKDSGGHPRSPAVDDMITAEKEAGINTKDFYQHVQVRAEQVKRELVPFVRQAKAQGKKIGAYGAAAKGNTLLNYCGITDKQIDFVADASPHKQGKYLPGSHIPVVSETQLRQARPDYVLILPWNLKDEITELLTYIRGWGGKFVIPIPCLDVY